MAFSPCVRCVRPVFPFIGHRNVGASSLRALPRRERERFEMYARAAANGQRENRGKSRPVCESEGHGT